MKGCGDGGSRAARYRPRPASSLARGILAATLLAATAGCGSSTSPSLPRVVPPTTATPAGTAGGTPAPVPHIMLVVDENQGYEQSLGSCGTGSPDPYLCSLAGHYASVTGWFGTGHPSLPNYLALISGSDQGCGSDGCTGPYTAPSLGGQLCSAGFPWIAYLESMPEPCFSGYCAGEYARKHDPFVDFTDVAAAPDCPRVVQPYPGAATMVSALDRPGGPAFVWITPHLIDDMHDSSVQAGDAWMRTNLPAVLASSWFAAGGAVIFTMDENDIQASGSCCGAARGGRVPLLVISSPSWGRGQVALTGDHYGTLRSIEEAYRLPLLDAAGDAGNGDLSSLIGY